MRRAVFRLFCSWDFDKEEKWLNKMAAKGLALVAVGFPKYIFEESQPGEYKIRLELLDHLPSHPESTQYIRFLEETGAEYLCSVLRWAYFRKKTGNDGEFTLFSDNNSRIKHLNRLLLLLGVVGLAALAQGVINIVQYLLTGIALNLGIGIFFSSMGLLIGYGFLRISQKKGRMKRELQVFE